MEKTLTQRIYETPLDIKEAIYNSGKQFAAEEIFRELETAMQRSKINYVGREVFNLILEDYVEDMKKKYGVK